MSYGSSTAKMLSTFHQNVGLNVLSSYCKDKNVSETHFIIQDSKFLSVWATFYINKSEAILLRLNHNVVKIVILLWNQIGAKYILRLNATCATKTVHSSIGLPTVDEQSLIDTSRCPTTIKHILELKLLLFCLLINNTSIIQNNISEKITLHAKFCLHNKNMFCEINPCNICEHYFS